MKNKIRKILIIVPPNTLPHDSLRRIGEPLGALYLGSALKAQGYDVEVFDTTCDDYDRVVREGDYVTYGSSDEKITERIAFSKPDLVAVTCMFTAREKNALRTARLAKESCPQAPVVIGGIHPSLFPEKMLENESVDFVVLREGEFRLGRLIQSLNEARLPDFEGIAYRDRGKKVVRPAVSNIEDLDTIPYPDRDLVAMERYIEIGVPYAPFSMKKRVAQILATRGCPNRCNFCSTVNYWGRRVRTRSVENIIGELRLLKDKYRIEEVQFVDDNLTADKKLAKELFLRMKDLGLKWCTPHGLMFNTLDKEMIGLMAGCGAYQLTFAVESASERVLKDIIHKNVRLERVKDIVAEAHRYDIGVHGMFVVGFPGETRQEIQQTFDFPFQALFDSVSFFVVNPVPGSELYDECLRKNYIDATYAAMDFKTAHIRIPKGSPEYNFDPKDLERMADDKTREYNEFSKKMFPERWGKKFSRFLGDHEEHETTIMGRVT